MVKTIMMFAIFLTCCMLMITAGNAEAKEKQIQLEDIERDNLAAERRAKQHQPLQQQLAAHYASQPSTLAQHITPPTPPKMQYGFLPVKAAPNYPQQSSLQTLYQYNPSQSSQTQAYFLTSPRQQINQHGAQVTDVDDEQPGAHLNYYPQTTYYQASHPSQTYQQYTGQSDQLAKNHLQSYRPQIQYIVGNSIQQHPTQKYYPQQFVYVQPIQSSSNNIHSVADTSGNVQYVMYIPTVYPQNGDNVLEYSNAQDAHIVYQTGPESPKPAEYSEVPQEEPAQPTPKLYARPVFKHHPTSLLDSYVPSILQYQYYKQQQQLESANAIKASLKLAATSALGKGDFVKSPSSAYGEHHRLKY